MAKPDKSEMKKTMDKWDKDLKAGREDFKKFMTKKHKQVLYEGDGVGKA